MTYGELKAQFVAVLNRTDLSTTLTELFINQAMVRCQRDLRTPAQENQGSTTIEEGFSSVTVPVDYVSMIAVMCDNKYVTYLPLSRFLELEETGTGTPMYWCRLGTTFQFRPVPAVGKVVDIYYYGEFTPFTEDDAETTISVVAPDLLIYGALSYAGDYFIDERTASFEGRYMSILQALQDQAYDADGPGIVQPTYSFGDD
jgi:hypothetical protein